MENYDLLHIVNKYGSSVYVYDSLKIKDQYTRLKKAFCRIENLKINYAMKALPNLAILKVMKDLGSGLDTVSIYEVQLGIMAGFKPSSIIYTPNGISMSELSAAVVYGVQINIDNLSLLEEFGTQYPTIPVSIRFNPHIMAGGNNNISVGHIDSKFGISIHQLPHVLRIIENTDMKINGLHMHTGSDILDIDVFLQASDILFDIALEFPDLEFLDFGSGFKVPYKDGDDETNIEELGLKMTRKFNTFSNLYNKDLALIFEPGKYLVSQAGYFLTSVNVVKQTTSTIFACINSGFNQFIRPMFYNAYHDIENLSNKEGLERFYTIVGNICESDTFATNRKLTEINKGDILCFKNAGAYCHSMASNYNLRPRPAEVLWDGIKPTLIRRAETFEDMINTQQ